MHWFCRHGTSTQITWQQTWYFSLFLRAMDNISFLYFKEVPSFLEKAKAFVKENF